MRALELNLLGRFECLGGNGEPITLPMRKAEVCLACLALAPGLRHPRERLINLLWSDRGEDQARNSLRQCLSALRKALGETADLVLVVDRTTVSVQAPMIEVDALEFERAAALRDRITQLRDSIGEPLDEVAIQKSNKTGRRRRGGKTGAKVPRPKRP